MSNTEVLYKLLRIMRFSKAVSRGRTTDFLRRSIKYTLLNKAAGKSGLFR